MGNNNLDLKIGEGKSLDDWVEAVEYDLHSIIYEIMSQIRDVLV